MDYLTSLFKRVFITPSLTNFELVGQADYQPSVPTVNPIAIENHQATLRVAFEQYLNSDEYDKIVFGYKRTELAEDVILDDFFSGDLPEFPEPTDLKAQQAIQTGIDCMAEAFSPPIPAQPVQFYEVKHHYPYKWHVNAEVPFSTHKYFLSIRKKFADFYDAASHTWTKYVNPLDALRRYGPNPTEATLNQVTPPRFGFMSSIVFDYVHQWLHIVKSGFTDFLGYQDNNFIRMRFIFPMLLHLKTAVVPFDAPNKLRTIWGVSKAWIIAETQIYWEYIAWIKLNPGLTPMLWGYETFTGGWYRLYRDLFSAKPVSYITIDWSRFDKRANFWLIRRIFARTRTFFNLEEGYVPTFNYPTSPTNPSKLQRLWEWTLENFFTAPIVLPDGRMYKRRFMGIPSGLFITQLMDSWYNYVMLASILAYLGFDPRQCLIKVQGDDSIIRLYFLIAPELHDLFLQQMQSAADILFGSIISLDKSEIRNTLTKCEVLSYRNDHGLPYRDLIKMLAQFYHTKAKDPTPGITMAQAIGFAYASCATDPRILECLESIYDYYAKQGYTPHAAGISLVFGDSPDRPDYDISLDHFPTRGEIIAMLVSADYRNHENEEKTWPRTIFLNPPCSR